MNCQWMSHLTWVRGLKPHIQSKVARFLGSHLTWVRGLKLPKSQYGDIAAVVAPYVGAWVETINWNMIYILLVVGPYLGAWV